MKKLDVIFRGWNQDWVLGTLAEAAGKIYFEYSALALKRGIEHSPHVLPLAPGAHTDFPPHLNGLPGFINDALPDGWGMRLMDRLFRLADREPATVSPLDRLSFIGERAMGALAFKPSANASMTPADLSLQALAESARALIEDEAVDALNTLAWLGGSPHGARPKVLVQYDASSGRVSTNADAPGEPWLVKFQAATEHAEVCAVEQVYADMARTCGIDMPPSRHFALGKNLAAFGVARFDREQGARVPVLSIAAALHVNFREPCLDYVTLLRIVRFFSRDEREVLKAYRQCVFNVVFNNQDDHAKNFALRMGSDMHWRLSPAFDLTFARGPGGQHQTSVAGSGVPGRDDLLRLADQGGVARSTAEVMIEQLRDQGALLAGALKNTKIRAITVRDMLSAVSENIKRCA